MMVNYRKEKWCVRCQKKYPKVDERCPECGCVLRRRPLKNREVSRL